MVEPYIYSFHDTHKLARVIRESSIVVPPGREHPFFDTAEVLIHFLFDTTTTYTQWFYRAELQTTLAKPDVRGSNPGSGAADEDASLTRDQALERFGIDLGRVGVMTSARTARSGGGENSSDSGLGQVVAAAAAGIASNPAGIGREKEDIKPNRTRNKQGRAGSFVTTREDGRDALAKRQELLSEKLKVLDKLLSDEPPCLALAEDDENNEEEQEYELNTQPGDRDPAVVAPEDNGTEETNIAPELVADLSSGGGAGRRGTPNVWSLEKTPSSKRLVAKKSVRSCRDMSSKPRTDVHTPEPTKVTTANAAHSSREKRGGEGDRGPVTDFNGDVLLEKAPAKEVVGVERCHIYEKAFPNHR